MVVELKEGQEITVSCSRDAKFSDSVIPISSGSPQEIGLTAESEIFVGQYLFTGSENTSAFLTAKEVRQPAQASLKHDEDGANVNGGAVLQLKGFCMSSAGERRQRAMYLQQHLQAGGQAAHGEHLILARALP
jgi:hypothetical protein